jgi:hypothetical protein
MKTTKTIAKDEIEVTWGMGWDGQKQKGPIDILVLKQMYHAVYVRAVRVPFPLGYSVRFRDGGRGRHNKEWVVSPVHVTGNVNPEIVFLDDGATFTRFADALREAKELTRAAARRVGPVEETPVEPEPITYRVESVENHGSIVVVRCVEVISTKKGWRKKAHNLGRFQRTVNFDARMYGNMREDFPEGIVGKIVNVLGVEFEGESFHVIE